MGHLTGKAGRNVPPFFVRVMGHRVSFAAFRFLSHYQNQSFVLWTTLFAHALRKHYAPALYHKRVMDHHSQRAKTGKTSCHEPLPSCFRPPLFRTMGHPKRCQLSDIIGDIDKYAKQDKFLTARVMDHPLHFSSCYGSPLSFYGSPGTCYEPPPYVLWATKLPIISCFEPPIYVPWATNFQKTYGNN